MHGYLYCKHCLFLPFCSNQKFVFVKLLAKVLSYNDIPFDDDDEDDDDGGDGGEDGGDCIGGDSGSGSDYTTELKRKQKSNFSIGLHKVTAGV